MSPKNRVAVIGLDGMSWEFLNQLFECGAMPYLKNLARKSLTATLESTLPPVTPPAWTSIATGVNPGKHGIFGFWKVIRLKKGAVVRPVSAYDVMYPRIHEILEFFRLKSIVVNLNPTYPPEATTARHSVIVSDRFSPKIRIYPRDYKKYEEYFKKREVGDFLENEEEHVKNMIEGTKLILKKNNCSLLFIVFDHPDELSHKMELELKKKGIKIASKIFRSIDKFIEYLHGEFDNLIMVSDHGIKLFPQSVSIQAMLNKAGINTTVPLRTSIWRKIPKPLHPILKSKKVRPIAKQIAEKLSKLKNTYMHKSRGKNVKVSFVDYKTSPAFIGSPDTLYIDPNHTEEVEETLLKYKELINVFKANEIYSGPYLKFAPDYIVTAKGDFDFAPDEDHITIYRERYSHSLHGILITTDPKLNEEQVSKTWDVAPMILNFLNLPMPSDSDCEFFSHIKKRSYLMRWFAVKRIRMIKY